MGHAGDGSGIDGNSCEGLVLGNQGHKRGEPLVTVDKLKNTFLFGVPILDAQGNTPSPEFYQQNIDTAISYFEHLLDISITPVIAHKEYKDYRLNDYADWGSILLSNYPVIQLRSMRMVYFRDDTGLPITVQEIPLSWIRLQRHDGLLRLIPYSLFPAQLQISSTGTFFPEILSTQNIPHLWEFTYDYGFENGKIPTALNQAISMYAAVLCFITAGHLALGQAGLAGTSINLDGLSQSITTTASAENSAFSSTIKDITDRLFGKNSNDPTSLLNVLKEYYKSGDMNII